VIYLSNVTGDPSLGDLPGLYRRVMVLYCALENGSALRNDFAWDESVVDHDSRTIVLPKITANTESRRSPTYNDTFSRNHTSSVARFHHRVGGINFTGVNDSIDWVDLIQDKDDDDDYRADLPPPLGRNVTNANDPSVPAQGGSPLLNDTPSIPWVIRERSGVVQQVQQQHQWQRISVSSGSPNKTDTVPRSVGAVPLSDRRGADAAPRLSVQIQAVPVSSAARREIRLASSKEQKKKKQQQHSHRGKDQSEVETKAKSLRGSPTKAARGAGVHNRTE
jgi:hypothetical protein